MDELKLRTEFIEVHPDEMYELWLHPDGHSEMTGSPATGSMEVGGEFTAWDGYIRGKHVVLEPGVRIVQSWRTTQFADDDADSELEILFEATDDGGTIVTLLHRNLPEGSGDDYAEGWETHYFDPIRDFLGQATWAEDDSEE